MDTKQREGTGTLLGAAGGAGQGPTPEAPPVVDPDGEIESDESDEPDEPPEGEKKATRRRRRRRPQG